MAKRKVRKIEKHVSYCAGKHWEGDGSKNTSPCPFNSKKEIEAVRYMCFYCVTGIKPSDIIADANGIHHENIKPLPEPDLKLVNYDENGKPIKRGRGRPKGSKNKSKDPIDQPKTSEEPSKPRIGRPKGSKNKLKVV